MITIIHENIKYKPIEYEDDLVVVYDSGGEEVYKGLEDYEPYKDENWEWDSNSNTYKCNGFTKVCLDV